MGDRWARFWVNFGAPSGNVWRLVPQIKGLEFIEIGSNFAELLEEMNKNEVWARGWALRTMQLMRML